MKDNVLVTEPPCRQAFMNLNSRWGALVLVVLLDDTKRFAEIRNSIDGISEKRLSETLKQLEKDGMLIRTDYHTVPPKVEYSLTEFGKEASIRFRELGQWLTENLLRHRQNPPEE